MDENFNNGEASGLKRKIVEAQGDIIKKMHLSNRDIDSESKSNDCKTYVEILKKQEEREEILENNILFDNHDGKVETVGLYTENSDAGSSRNVGRIDNFEDETYELPDENSSDCQEIDVEHFPGKNLEEKTTEDFSSLDIRKSGGDASRNVQKTETYEFLDEYSSDCQDVDIKNSLYKNVRKNISDNSVSSDCIRKSGGDTSNNVEKSSTSRDEHSDSSDCQEIGAPSQNVRGKAPVNAGHEGESSDEEDIKLVFENSSGDEIDEL